MISMIAFLAGLIVGVELADKVWKKKLVQENHAEYHTKTAQWQLRSTADIATEGAILGVQR